MVTTGGQSCWAWGQSCPPRYPLGGGNVPRGRDDLQWGTGPGGTGHGGTGPGGTGRCGALPEVEGAHISLPADQNEVDDVGGGGEALDLF